MVDTMDKMSTIGTTSGIDINKGIASSASVQTEPDSNPCKLLTTAYPANDKEGRRVIVFDYKVTWDPKESTPPDDDLVKLKRKGDALLQSMNGWEFEDVGPCDEDERVEECGTKMEDFATGLNLTGQTYGHVEWQTFERCHPKGVLPVARSQELSALEMSQSWESSQSWEMSQSWE